MHWSVGCQTPERLTTETKSTRQKRQTPSSGFRPANSYTGQVLAFTEHIEKGSKREIERTGVVFMGRSAAYDTVNQRNLLAMISKTTKDFELTKVIESLLQNRRRKRANSSLSQGEFFKTRNCDMDRKRSENIRQMCKTESINDWVSKRKQEWNQHINRIRENRLSRKKLSPDELEKSLPYVGYEGSLLKVTSKNGKTASVSV
ncbi:hypothetical protein YQE_02862, partial [Dendroctonus ponderosae]